MRNYSDGHQRLINNQAHATPSGSSSQEMLNATDFYFAVYRLSLGWVSTKMVRDLFRVSIRHCLTNLPTNKDDKLSCQYLFFYRICLNMNLYCRRDKPNTAKYWGGQLYGLASPTKILGGPWPPWPPVPTPMHILL